MTFRLLTYNIMHGGIGRIDAIATVINSCSPDLVLLQEATDAASVTRLAEATGMAEGRAFQKQSLGFLSRRPVSTYQWIRPRISRHAFLEVIPEGERVCIFGVHLAAVHAAWTERRRVMELRALLQSVERHRDRFHVLAGDFNTVAPGDEFELNRLPLRLRPLVWVSGGRVRWRTIQTVIDAGYVDAFKAHHPNDAGLTLPTHDPHIRLDYVFVPRGQADRLVACDVVRPQAAVGASDHFPVVADFELPDQSPSATR
jgi:exodeoxyribonuclease-3